MCTLVAVWMWVPRQQDLTMMGTNGCHSAAPPCSQTALFVLTNHKSPLNPGPQPLPQADQAVVRRISLFHFLLLFLAFSFTFSFLFFFFCCQVGFGACKWHNHVHISLSVLCICFTIQREKKKQSFSSITCSFLRAVWCDTCSCHSWCLAYASLS